MRVQIPPSAQIEDKMKKNKLIIICTLFSLLLTQQEDSTNCTIAKELYDNNNIPEAYFEINKLNDLNE